MHWEGSIRTIAIVIPIGPAIWGYRLVGGPLLRRLEGPARQPPGQGVGGGGTPTTPRGHAASSREARFGKSATIHPPLDLGAPPGRIGTAKGQQRWSFFQSWP